MSLLFGCSLAIAFISHDVVSAAVIPSDLRLSRRNDCVNCEDSEGATAISLLQLRANGSAVKERTNGAPSLQSMDKHDRTTLKGMFPYYHTTTEIHDEVRALARGCAGAVTSETISDSGVDIELVRVRAPKASPVNRVFALFGEHSRELISPESGLHFLRLLCGKVALEGALTAPDLLRDNEFQLVLNGNPRSRDRVENGEYCIRTNPSGVDLNRNWDEKWEAGETRLNTNSGPSPFSEPETRIFKHLVSKFKPTTFLTVHSGTRGLYMPFAYDLDHMAQYNAPLMLDVLKDLDKDHCQCPYGAAGKEVGYSCPGTCLDWVYEELRTPFVFAFEIYVNPDEDASLRRRWDEKMQSGGLMLLENGHHLGHDHFADLFQNATSDFVQRRAAKEMPGESAACFAMFNPGTEESYNATIKNWAVAYAEMSSKIAALLKNDTNKALLDHVNKAFDKDDEQP